VMQEALNLEPQTLGPLPEASSCPTEPPPPPKRWARSFGSPLRPHVLLSPLVGEAEKNVGKTPWRWGEL
jgi:hypothetical protein